MIQEFVKYPITETIIIPIPLAEVSIIIAEVARKRGAIRSNVEGNKLTYIWTNLRTGYLIQYIFIRFRLRFPAALKPDMPFFEKKNTLWKVEPFWRQKIELNGPES